MTRKFVAFGLAAAMLPTLAFSATPPAGVLMSGYVTVAPPSFSATQAGAWCMVDGAATTYVTTISPAATRISFSQIIYTETGSVGPTAYLLSGLADVVFYAGSQTKGRIKFFANPAYPTTVSQPTFTAYTQTYNSGNHLLAVGFVIHFPNCDLPVSATYRS